MSECVHGTDHDYDHDGEKQDTEEVVERGNFIMKKLCGGHKIHTRVLGLRHRLFMRTRIPWIMRKVRIRRHRCLFPLTYIFFDIHILVDPGRERGRGEENTSPRSSLSSTEIWQAGRIRRTGATTNGLQKAEQWYTEVSKLPIYQSSTHM